MAVSGWQPVNGLLLIMFRLFRVHFSSFVRGTAVRSKVEQEVGPTDLPIEQYPFTGKFQVSALEISQKRMIGEGILIATGKSNLFW